MHYGMLLSNDQNHDQALPDHFEFVYGDESVWTWLGRHLRASLYKLCTRFTAATH